MRAHLVQMDIAWENRDANHGTVERMLDGADVRAGDLVVLPELFDVGFTLDLDAAPDADDRTLGFLGRVARERGVTVHGSRAVRDDAGKKALNTAVVVGAVSGGEGGAACESRVLCVYAKVHPFSFGREPESYRGGERIERYDWVSGGDRLAVCPAVCYDLRFPELFRIGALRGAEGFVLGANWPAARHAHWRTLLLARAIENQAFVLGVNRAGDDPYLSYAGGSLAVSPTGEVLGELGPEPGVLTVEIDPDAARAWRERFPALRDLRLRELR